MLRRKRRRRRRRTKMMALRPAVERGRRGRR
ncbi:hypothetical protein E2C01_079599 [Portunus trituberculatus]|uniref:Uncharacterized protein n=1 Tax=Portunus trituberculatus TaxID=210409 RepID=A0A5B7IRU3_PORTR|nr:hypothetical protein [Portunus trituberculatus]